MKNVIKIFAKEILWGGGALEKKTSKKEGGLGIRNLVVLSKALLGKWSWRFATKREPLWKQIITRKFGVEEGGWCLGEVREGYGVGMWKAIKNEWEGIRSRSRFLVGNGKMIKFWKNL